MATQLLETPAAFEIKIEVVGSDLDGQQYLERTHTVAITRDGAMIVLANKLAPESELLVRNLDTDQEAVVRVIGHIRETDSGHIYGIAFMDPTIDFWQIPLSPPQYENPIILECSRCHTVKPLSLTKIEMEIFRAKRDLTYRCGCNVVFTVWKETQKGVSAEVTGIQGNGKAPEQSRAALSDPARVPLIDPPAREKRKDCRVAISAQACIRHGGREEIAICEDISRGGFRFKSRGEYPAGTRIEAAVPYTQSNANIFVPARIVYHQELSANSHRHGVTYLNKRQISGK